MYCYNVITKVADKNLVPPRIVTVSEVMCELFLTVNNYK
jgi:hypothetical protein